MNTLEEILKAWETDSQIDPNKLDKSSVDTSLLHAKYLQFLSLSKIRLNNSYMSQKLLLKDKWLYYNGKMSKEELQSKGWNPDPFNGLKILKGEMDYYYNSDPELQESDSRIQYLKTMVETLQEIVDNIKWRHQTIGNIIKWKMFEAGI